MSEGFPRWAHLTEDDLRTAMTTDTRMNALLVGEAVSEPRHAGGSMMMSTLDDT